MKTGEFIKVVAAAYRVDEKTVTLFSRLLKEAGLLTTGARGVNAPEMTPLDAARLTIALLATDRPANAVELTRVFCDLTVNREMTEGPAPSFASNSEYAATLEEVLQDYFTGQSMVFVEVKEIEVCEETQEAVIFVDSGQLEQNRRNSVTFDGDFESVKSLRAGEDFWGRRTKRLLVNSALIPVALALRHIAGGEG